MAGCFFPGSVRADTWYCNCCKQTFPLDPRDRARYFSEWVPLHQSVCCNSSRPQIGTPVTPNNMRQQMMQQGINAAGGALQNLISGAFQGPSAAEIEAQRQQEVEEQRRRAELERLRLEAERRARIARAAQIRSGWDVSDNTITEELRGVFNVPMGPNTPTFGQGGSKGGSFDPFLDDSTIVDLRGTTAGGAPSNFSTAPVSLIGATADAPILPTGGAGISTGVVDPAALGSIQRAGDTEAYYASESRWSTLPTETKADPASESFVTGDLIADHLKNVSLLGDRALNSLSAAANANAYGASDEELYQLEHLSEHRGAIFERRMAASLMANAALQPLRAEAPERITDDAVSDIPAGAAHDVAIESPQRPLPNIFIRERYILPPGAEATAVTRYDEGERAWLTAIYPPPRLPPITENSPPIRPDKLIPVIGHPGKYIRYRDIPLKHIVNDSGWDPDPNHVVGSALSDASDWESLERTHYREH